MEERKTNFPARTRQVIKTYVPPAARVLLCLTLVAAAVHGLARLSTPFADFINRYVAGAVRFALAKISGIIPFSFAETVLIALPLLLVILIVCASRMAQNKRGFWRYMSSMLAVLGTLYTLFVFTIGCGYHGTTLDRHLLLTRKDVSSAELYDTALILMEETNRLASEFPRAEGASVMPYAVDELNDRLLTAYDKLSEEHSFLQRMRTRIKSVSLSDAMSYTHITGVYTYMTGEANLNVAFPDYTLPFTAAHELAHQRGIAREDEANFVAFLVCIASDDPYIQYSGYFNMMEYVASALYQADPSLYKELVKEYARPVRQEINAYWDFYEKYQDSVVGEISGAVNDAYLQLQGTPGTRSYGMVVDLAVAYYKES
jgi:hypothetical protein